MAGKNCAPKKGKAMPFTKGEAPAPKAKKGKGK
jgi:hypothetical protein